MCREASDTSDAWQDLASPENILALIEIALTVLEQQEKGEMDIIRIRELLKNNQTDTYRQIENDGWIEWRGGECPVPNSTVVQVKYRAVYDDDEQKASLCAWNHDGAYDDIIAYRVIENDGREG